MKKTMTKVAVALTAAGALALPASQAAAGTSKTESALIGAVLGGVAGAAVGNGKTESMAIGAVAGAALGYAVDKSNDRKTYRSSRYRTTQPYYGARYPSDSRAYYGRTNSRYGYDRYGYDRYGYRR
ncbi:glycine zipper 2TM domain-containing protein [Phenylobacterium sp.]|uniref:glycine zipper 2TM domain-containing protein n=1 Tax=Phenylobacterium sp. TaxID=1871053 RepID=UPI002FDF2D23